jgi:hypothetical protein
MHMRRVIAVLSFSLSLSSSNSSHKTRRSHLVPALLSHVVPRRGVQISQPGHAELEEGCLFESEALVLHLLRTGLRYVTVSTR